MTLGTRVAVMREGTIQQVDTPQVLYREPVNLFVAAFIGSPSMNLVEAEVSDEAVEFAGFRVPLRPDRRPARTSGTVILGLRPQDFLEPDSAGAAGLPTIDAEAVVVEELGSATHVIFAIEAPPVEVDAVRAASDDESTKLLATDRRALFTAEVGESTEIRPGDRIRLAPDPARLHFFDRETSETLRSRAVAAAVG
jgi:multiple sugar transport system ATP-binding protein